MPKLHDQWTILPHGALREVEHGILTVTGDIPMPLGKFPRRMTVVGLSRKRTAIYSAISLDEAAMQRIEALGRPSFLIVPSAAHRLDSRSWKKRYPEIEVVAPPGARAKVGEAVAVDSTGDVLRDRQVALEIVDGTGGGEVALRAHRGDRVTIICNDIIANVRQPRGIGAKIMVRAMGFGLHGPRTPRIVRRMLVDDAAALAAQLRRWAAIEGLKRVIVSHGEMLSDNPAGALRAVAKRLES